tara:strand:- start:2085 stop:2495 length:411 start_codon:yes stop_codon:yes gene_type:complete
MPLPKLNKSDFYYFVTMETRWKDMDALGHMNNAIYLTYSESARLEWCLQNGFDEPPFIVVSIKVDYLKQLKHPATLHVGQKISRVGSSSFDFLSAVFKNDETEPTAVILTTLVCFDYETQKTVAVPQLIKDQFKEK